jgi:hypothetical protein
MKLSEIFNELLEGRIEINNSSDLAIIFIEEGNIFLLINTNTGQPKGYISFSPTQGDVYSIYGAYADKGYGPLLYELVMTYVYPKGVTMSDDSSTSQDAINVWEKFASRNDVIKKPIIRTQKTDKEEWFDDMTSDYEGDIRAKKWIDRVRELHNTQFIYNLGKNKLGELIKRGDLYLSKNPNLNLMGMVYSLER